MDYPSSEPLGAEIERLAADKSGPLAQAVSDWYENSDRSLESWQRMLREQLEDVLVDHLTGAYSTSLADRGIDPAGEYKARLAVRRALLDTDDLRRRILDAPVRAVTAAFYLNTLLNSLHQNRIIQSITRHIQDLFGIDSVQDSEATFTGRRRWRTSVVSSRHANLNFQVRGPGEPFQVGPYSWMGPRGDITAAAEASGCKCWLQYERTDGTWV